MRILLVCLLAASILEGGPADSAIVPLMRSANADIVHVAVLKRVPVDQKLDLVIASGTPKQWLPQSGEFFGWSPQIILGIFLQNREQPSTVYKIALQTGIDDCSARIERVTATDVMLSCRPEKGSGVTNRKFVYDIRAKALVKQFDYRRFQLDQISSQPRGVILSGQNWSFDEKPRPAAIRYTPDATPPFALLTGWDQNRQPFHPLHFGPGNRFALTQEGSEYAKRLVLQERLGRALKSVPLPQSTFDVFTKARPQSVKYGLTRQGATIDEEIGPTQLVEGTLWFGKTFYDGEGNTGVGGFGYFDAEQRQFQIYSPPEIADWSVTALLVEPETVWMALAHRGEYGGSAGGLLRFDRATEKVTKIALPDIAYAIQRVNGRLILATESGAAIVDGDQISRFFIDQTTDGRLRVAQAILSN